MQWATIGGPVVGNASSCINPVNQRGIFRRGGVPHSVFAGHWLAAFPGLHAECRNERLSRSGSSNLPFDEDPQAPRETEQGIGVGGVGGVCGFGGAGRCAQGRSQDTTCFAC